MKVVIIEDETLAAREMVKLLHEIDTQILVLAILTNVKEAKKWFKENSAPDLIFSDIQLADGISFEIFEELSLNIPVVFTTAYHEYSLRAFKLNSIDYLLKPIDKIELIQTIQKFKKTHDLGFNTNYSQDLKSFLNNFKNQSQSAYKNRFLAHKGNAIIGIDVSQIAFFQIESVVIIQTLKNEQFVTDFNGLEELEEVLDPIAFFRANRQYIVNKNAIQSIKAHYTGKINIEIINSPKTEITVSKEKAKAFRLWFEK